MKTTTLFDGWRGMTPDKARDKMDKGTVWLMRDYIPDELGSQLESRSPWVYHVNGPLNGPVRTQRWISTLGYNHHLAATAATVYSLNIPGSPAVVASGSGYDNPIASLYEYVGVPRADGNLPTFLKYTSAGAVSVLTTHASTPPAKHIEAWNAYFVLANYPGFAQRVAWLEPGFPLTGTTTPAFDTKAWWDTSNDVTGLARTRSALICFHAEWVERLRGGIPPGTNRQTDLWMEPLKGSGGCTQPQSISFWNDNVLFCDGRGAYLTDGTQITDLAAQGGISRPWRARYRSGLRISGGVLGNYWVLTAVDAANGTFVDTWVCDLYARRWFQLTNTAFSSMTTAVAEKEVLYGGTWDGKVVDASRMWDEADPVTANVDGNGVAVLPQLETAFYRLSKDEAMKRVRNAFISYDFDEDTGALNVYVCQQVHPRTTGVGAGTDWKLLKSLRMTDLDAVMPLVDSRGYARRRLPLGLEAYGFAFKLETTGTLRNLKLYDLSVEGPGPREESYA